jgi:hypothetical protein
MLYYIFTNKLIRERKKQTNKQERRIIKPVDYYTQK